MNELRPSDWGITSLIVFSPLLGAALALLWPRRESRLMRWGIFVWSLIPLGLVLYLWWSGAYDPTARATLAGTPAAVIQQVDRLPWLRAPLRADYVVGIDGINLPLIILTTTLTPVVLLVALRERQHARTHLALLLFLETALLGAFTALDFLLFFLFWELSLVPMFFMMLAGAAAPRRAAAMKFFVYTMAGSVGMLLAFQFLYLATAAAGEATLDLARLARLGSGAETIAGKDLAGIIFAYAQQLGLTRWFGGTSERYAAIIFWAIFLAFAIKLAVWPLHTWMPAAYAESETDETMIMAGAMSKLGAYGMMRLALPLLPDAAREAAPIIALLGLASVILGAYAGLAQTDIKRLIAYTSVNHMGLVTIGVAAAAVGNGSLDSRASALNGIQMMLVAHGFSTAALFYVAGILHRRTGTYDLQQFGGLRQVAPTLAGVTGVALFASLGVPGLANFAGEFLIFRGAWAALPLITTLAAMGLVVLALQLLRMFQAIFDGRPSERSAAMRDLSRGELLTALPLLLPLLLFGIYPAIVLDLTSGTIAALSSVFAQ